jgi:hypothetical protein
VLSVSAELLGLHMNPMLLDPASEVHDDELDHDPETGILLPFAWIVTHHATNNHLGENQQERHRRPEIVIRTLHANQYLLEYEIASLLGYWHHEHVRLNDPMAPTSTITVPKEAGIVALLHQYVIALLCLPRDCPASWTCHCNAIRARFNAPPPDHESPTSVFSVAEIEAASANRRRTDPLFPYNGANPWTNTNPDEAADHPTKEK